VGVPWQGCALHLPRSTATATAALGFCLLGAAVWVARTRR